MPAVGRAVDVPAVATPFLATWSAAGMDLTASGANSPVVLTRPNIVSPDALVIMVGSDPSGTVATPEWHLVLYERTIDVVIGVFPGISADSPTVRLSDPDNVATAPKDKRVHVPLLFDVRGAHVPRLGSPAHATPEWFLALANIGGATNVFLFSFGWVAARPL